MGRGELSPGFLLGDLTQGYHNTVDPHDGNSTKIL